MKLLTVAEVAEILRIHRRSIIDMIHAGEIPAINLGSNRAHGARWRVEAHDLENYVKNRRVPLRRR